MYVIGLTGGIACGKSTAVRILLQAGACILDADKLAHELAEPGGLLYKAYLEHFGDRILQDDGTLDRRAIGELVFRRPEEREWMNRTSHPILLRELKRRMEECRLRGERLILLDVPLLWEAGWHVLCDEIWVVAVPEEIQLQRLMQRDNLTADQARDRIRSQMSLEEKCRLGDRVIDNSGGEEHMKEQIEALFAERVSSLQGESL